MDYSTEFLRKAARAAQAEMPAEPWMALPIGQRVTAIYREMQRIENENASRRARERQGTAAMRHADEAEEGILMR